MTFLETFQAAILWTLGIFLAAGLWVFRNVLTNGKRIDLLEQEAKHQAEMRQSNQDEIKAVRTTVDEIKTHLMKSK